MLACVICGGELGRTVPLCDFEPRILAKKAELLIAADRGLEYALEMGLSPHVFIGDMDSIGDSGRTYLKTAETEVIRLQTDKDDTDSEAALKLAVERGASKIMFIAALGGFVDHTLANVLLLYKAESMGTEASICGETEWVSLLLATGDPRTRSIPASEGDTVTLLPISERVDGIRTEGLLYGLKDESLLLGSTRGVSNRAVKTDPEVSIRSGALLLVSVSDRRR